MTAISRYSAEHIAVRDTLIREALRTGKIVSSRVQFWSQQFDADPDGTKAWLARLTPAANLTASVAPAGSQASDGYDSSWLSPTERARVNTARSGQRSIIDQTHD
jgi:hypothetical protein